MIIPKTLMFAASCSFLFACTNEPSKNNTSSTKEETKTNSFNCYSFVKNRDTVELKTISVGDSITGTLIYNLYEKDKNSGTIQGKMSEDVLVADYAFYSEGVKSIRQVAFKKTGTDFVEGFGDIEEKEGKMVFKNLATLDFGNTIVLKPVDCEQD